MTNDEMEIEFRISQSFQAIIIILTLFIICIIVTDGNERRANAVKFNEKLDKISGQCEIFQDSVPYDPARKKRIKAEKTGNFNEFEKGVDR